MMTIKNRCSKWGIGCLLLLLATSVFAASAFWYEKASGYKSALYLAKQKDKPFIIYFASSTCGYCKQLESVYFEDFETTLLLNKTLKVKIMPENSRDEKALKDEFNVHGYPSLFVYHPNKSYLTKIHPFRKKSKDWSTDEFREHLKRTLQQ